MSDQVKILLVDDNEDDRYLLRRCLKASSASSYAVTEASTGEEGLGLINREWFACVLLDYSLPDRSGVAILKPIRSAHPFLPVIMLTGLGNEMVAVAAMRAGAQNYIAKSAVTTQTLDHSIEGAIQHCEMQGRIAAQGESLEIFARALAHDLKEPLRTMRSMLDAVQEEATFPGETLDYFRSIQNCAVRMTSLIDTVRVYTRLDGVQRAVCDECDAKDLVRAAIDGVGQLVRERDAVITLDSLPIIFADRQQAIQVFQNILSNAIRHCLSTPVVAVTATETADFWQFQVKDNGPGISDEERGKLFKPFTRFSRSDTQGMGMGLATCKKLMEQHRGRIWCESPPDGGALFSISFPKVSPGEAKSGVQDVLDFNKARNTIHSAA